MNDGISIEDLIEFPERGIIVPFPVKEHAHPIHEQPLRPFHLADPIQQNVSESLIGRFKGVLALLLAFTILGLFGDSLVDLLVQGWSGIGEALSFIWSGFVFIWNFLVVVVDFIIDVFEFVFLIVEIIYEIIKFIVLIVVAIVCLILWLVYSILAYVIELLTWIL